MHDRTPIRGLDHIGITVLDLEAASQFLVEAFGANPMYDNVTHGQEPQAGAKAEAEAVLLLVPGRPVGGDAHAPTGERPRY